jgi:hypothetical protein
MRRRSTLLLVALLATASFALAFALTPPRGPRSLRQFDADRLASLETRMWEAYYKKERARLFSLLVTLLHEQYHYSWATATIQGFHLARAAATFADLKEHYEVVLPDLETAYEMVRSWTGSAFDAHAVARAELDWWAARRIPGHNSVEQVGQLIAEEYALLYESSAPAMAAPALLRARAAQVRDEHADNPDWSAIESLLRESYRELRLALSSANV